MGTISRLPADVDIRHDQHERLAALYRDQSILGAEHNWNCLIAALHELGVTACNCTNRIVGALGGIEVRSDGS